MKQASAELSTVIFSHFLEINMITDGTLIAKLLKRNKSFVEDNIKLRQFFLFMLLFFFSIILEGVFNLPGEVDEWGSHVEQGE